MSVLDSIETPRDRALICTICGDSGMGKTSLAATFPKPIFIRVEDGLQAIPAGDRPDAFPLVGKASDLWAQLTALCNDDHDYQTCVIDSISALERLFIADVLASDPKAKSINQALGGYGAGVNAVSAMHQRVRKAAGILNTRRNMHVVFVAHADIESMKLPDQDDYNRYSVRLPPKSQPPYVDDVDLVGFLRLTTYVMGEEGDRKKAVSTGARELICYATAANVSKNRFGIEDALPVDRGENPLIGVVPGLMAETDNGVTFSRAETEATKEEETS